MGKCRFVQKRSNAARRELRDVQVRAGKRVVKRRGEVDAVKQLAWLLGFGNCGLEDERQPVNGCSCLVIPELLDPEEHIEPPPKMIFSDASQDTWQQGA